MLTYMAKQHADQYLERIYTFILIHTQPSGEFPTTHEIARRCNVSYDTAFYALKRLEKRGLIVWRRGRMVNGKRVIHRRLRKSQ
jgi:Mn-dependent DtxR family transcriptional regulator